MGGKYHVVFIPKCRRKTLYVELRQPADLGIEAGDIILEVSRKAVHTADDIGKALNEARSAGRHAALMRIKIGQCDTFRCCSCGTGVNPLAPAIRAETTLFVAELRKIQAHQILQE
jgi:hypothetical protein